MGIATFPGRVILLEAEVSREREALRAQERLSPLEPKASGAATRKLRAQDEQQRQVH